MSYDLSQATQDQGFALQLEIIQESPSSKSIVCAAMRALSSIALVLSALRGVVACPVSGNPAIDSFVESETQVSRHKLLCNIGSDGCEAAGVSPGVVIASPSKSDPDCEFWSS